MNYFDETTNRMRQIRWMKAMTQVFQKTANVVSQRDTVNVALGDTSTLGSSPGEAPAGWSTESAIFFNLDKLVADRVANTMEDFFLRVRGVFYHELSHVIFSPWSNERGTIITTAAERMNAKRREKMEPLIRDEWIDRAWQYLEEGRIETQFMTRFPSAANFFEAAVLSYVLTDKPSTPMTWCLIAGRPYLLPEIYQAVKQAAIDEMGKDWADAVQQVHREHSAVNYFGSKRFKRGDMDLGSQSVAAGHVQRLTELMIQAQLSGDDPGPDQGEPKGGSPCPHGSAGHKYKSKTAVKVLTNQSSSEAAEEAETWYDGQDEAEAEGADGNAKKSEASSAKTNGTSEGDADPEQDQQSSAGSSGTRNEAKDGAADPQWVEIAKGVLIDIKTSTSIRQQAASFSASIEDLLTGGSKASWENAQQVGHKPPSAEVAVAKAQLEQLFGELHNWFEPEIRHHQRSGRLNPRRVMEGMQSGAVRKMTIFDDMPNTSMDGASMEIVILLDASGSMAGQVDTLSEVAWLIKRSSEVAEVNVTIIVYDTEHRILYTADQTAGETVPMFKAGGGTNPTSALQSAVGIFQGSEAATKHLIILTDGAWSRGSFTDTMTSVQWPKLMEVMTADPTVEVTLFGLRFDVSRRDIPCNHVDTIRDIGQLLDFFRNLVDTAMTDAMWSVEV